MCKVEGCVGVIVSNGLCDKHRKRLARHGSLDSPRSEDWGKREVHPLYSYWCGIKRDHIISTEWEDFWKFVGDVGERPSKDFVLKKKDSKVIFSLSNVEWTKKIRVSDFNSPAEYMRDYRKRNPEVHKNIDLKKSFGITLDQYNKKREEQNGVCAICGNPETTRHNNTDKTRNLAVDHCHVTGKVRGLLCTACNQGIGNFREDTSRLQKAIQYLEEHK